MGTQQTLSEQNLHELWWRQQIPAKFLRTTQAQLVEIIDPGEYNRDAGPDFRRATIRLDGKILQGDIELHLDANDWFTHQHHRDAKYNNVILHLALEAAAAPVLLRKENGLIIPQILLPGENILLSEPSLQISPTIVDCPLSRTAPEKIHATVRQAGLLRLSAKAEAFAEQVTNSSWDQALYRGLAEAMGYDKNQEPFRRLTELLPIDLIFSELRAGRSISPSNLLDALLFGAAGFFSSLPTQIPEPPIAAFLAPRIQLWETLRHTLQIRPLHRESWQFFRLRPPNFPTRRLAGLAALLLKFYRDGLLEHLSGIFFAAAKVSVKKRSKMIIAELLNYFVCPADEFWQNYNDFLPMALDNENSEQGILFPVTQYGDLIGRDRALDILANIVLPALWQYGRQAGDARLQNLVQEVYGGFPRLQENQITRAMRRQLAAQFPMSRTIATSALMQQGLIHLQKLYCRPLRCEECLRISGAVNEER